MDTASETSAAVAFGRFLVLPHRRELLADGQPVKLGGRAFDVLLTLIEARGAVITKDALMTRVWPVRIVEENALQSQMSALRMALGGDRDLVRTVSGRGVSVHRRGSRCRFERGRACRRRRRRDEARVGCCPDESSRAAFRADRPRRRD